MTNDELRRLIEELGAADDPTAALRAWDSITDHPDWPNLPTKSRLEALDDVAAAYAGAGAPANADLAVSTAQDTLDLTPADDADHPYRIALLAQRIRERYESSPSPGDLTRLVELSRAAVNESEPRAAELIRAWLEADLSAPRKQRHTARRVWLRLLDEKGAVVSESPIRALVHDLKIEIGLDGRLVVVPQTHDAGRDAEVDFGDFVAVIGGERLTLHMFVMRLSHSGRSVHIAYGNVATEVFLDGHVQGPGGHRGRGGRPPARLVRCLRRNPERVGAQPPRPPGHRHGHADTRVHRHPR